MPLYSIEIAKMIKHVYYVYLQKPFPSSLPIGTMYGK